MKILILSLCLLGVTACGEDVDNNNTTVRKAKECIDNGGIPNYTQDRFGAVKEWIGCTLP